jgi:HK97 family phage prohead protease
MTTLEHMVVPIEWKADDSDQNTLVGYASTFGNVDLGGDVVVKGAFDKTIENIKVNGIPLLADHMPSTASVLGTIYDAEPDEKGLRIWARISKAPSAQDTAVKLREGHLSKMSIGYETMDDAWEDKDGQRVRLLKEIKLWETSVVVFPMNPKATITRVKSVLDALDPEDRKAVLDQITDLSAQEPSEPEAQVVEPPVEAKVDDTTDTGGEPVSAPGEGASGYDKYASRAILAGRPVEDVDPVKRAELTTRLALAEGQLPPVEPE